MKSRMLAESELVGYLGTGFSYRDWVRALIAQQRETWPMLRSAIEGLGAVETRTFEIGGSVVRGQFNPGRMLSTSAKVDPATIGSRPCFLCSANLPPEERGIPFGEGYVVLCNPFPVLDDHLVISALEHVPQSMEGRIGHLLDLARELGPEWFCLYNGPRCGASAPDHLHFQAAAASGVPIFDELDSFSGGRESVEGGLFSPAGYRVNLAVIEGANRELIADRFDSLISRLRSGDSDEPMINLVVRYLDGRWRLIIYPRERHRPACFFAEGDARLTVSPAAIDLSGVVVIPEREHFDRITAADIAGIFREVTLNDDQMSAWLSTGGGV